MPDTFQVDAHKISTSRKEFSRRIRILSHRYLSRPVQIWTLACRFSCLILASLSMMGSSLRSTTTPRWRSFDKEDSVTSLQSVTARERREGQYSPNRATPASVTLQQPLRSSLASSLE